jgi:hypothetical protein
MIRLKNLLRESKYIGSCVDVGGDSGKEVCKYFPDATTLAAYVGNPDEGDWGKSHELTAERWYSYIDSAKVPAKAIKGVNTYHYIARDSADRAMSPSEASIFFIYNVDHDIHYFFRR